MLEKIIIWLPSIKYIVSGAFVTLQYTLTSVGIGFVIGALLALARLSSNKYLLLMSKIYTSIFRGTPILIQLSFVYFVLPGLLNIKLSVFAAGVISFSLNSGAYVSEIFRAGIQSIDKGQFEAARAFGVPYPCMIKDIVFPQAFKNILPALVNEVVNMLKESAIISVIGGADLMRRATIVASEKYTYFEPLIIAALCYYILVLFFSFIANKLEKKINASYDRN